MPLAGEGERAVEGDLKTRRPMKCGCGKPLDKLPGSPHRPDAMGAGGTDANSEKVEGAEHRVRLPAVIAASQGPWAMSYQRCAKSYSFDARPAGGWLISGPPLATMISDTELMARRTSVAGAQR